MGRFNKFNLNFRQALEEVTAEAGAGGAIVGCSCTTFLRYRYKFLY